MSQGLRIPEKLLGTVYFGTLGHGIPLQQRAYVQMFNDDVSVSFLAGNLLHGVWDLYSKQWVRAASSDGV